MAKNSPALPEDVIVTDILTRLPAKSIGRFRCVSKLWRSSLSSPQFLKAHLNFHIHDPPQHTIFPAGWLDHSDYILNLATKTCIDIGTSFSKGFWTNEISSCHGLVLLSQMNTKSEFNTLLVNPITREFQKIPDFWSGHSHVSCCLGYDSLNDDFKIVSLSDEISDMELTAMDIYSVRTKSWKRISDFPYNYHSIRAVFVNGCIHWLIRETDDSIVGIVAFSLAREEFNNVNPPLRLDWYSARLAVLGGCLALVINIHGNKSLEVWMMKEYGVQDSWTKFTINCPCGDNSVSALHLVCLLGDDEVLMVENYHRLVVYNFRNRVWRDMAVTGIPDHDVWKEYGGYVLRNMKSFGESLVSPNYK